MSKQYEAYFDNPVVIGWYPIETSRITNPERINEFITQGLLREIDMYKDNMSSASTNFYQAIEQEVDIPNGDKEIGSYSANAIIEMYKKQDDAIAFAEWLELEGYRIKGMDDTHRRNIYQKFQSIQKL